MSLVLQGFGHKIKKKKTDENENFTDIITAQPRGGRERL